MTEDLKIVAKKIIDEFKKNNGVSLTIEEIVAKVQGEIKPDDVKYVTRTLARKGLLYTEMITKHNPTYPFLKEIYFLSDEGWSFESYDEVLSKEKRKRDLEDALLQSSVKSNRWSPIFAGLAALFAFASVAVAIAGYKKPTEKVEPVLQQIRTTLQRQEQWLNNLQQNQKNTETELGRIADSLPTIKIKLSNYRRVK